MFCNASSVTLGIVSLFPGVGKVVGHVPMRFWIAAVIESLSAVWSDVGSPSGCVNFSSLFTLSVETRDTWRFVGFWVSSLLLASSLGVSSSITGSSSIEVIYH